MVACRPHIEFIQVQLLPWRRIGHQLARPDVEYKMLSRDFETGACSILLRYPPGWRRVGPEYIDAAEEFYVLDGSLKIDDTTYGPDCYGWVPNAWTHNSIESTGGAVVLAFYDREPRLHPGTGNHAVTESPIFVDARTMQWDTSLNDPKLAHLGLSRKNLRTNTKTGERTFLSLAFPQSTPKDAKGPKESHPCVEEAYVLSGEMAGPHGVMYPGAYFWRPPGLPHGPFGTRWGCVMLIRFVEGRHVNLWSAEEASFRLDPPYAPVLPEELAPLFATTFVPPPAW